VSILVIKTLTYWGRVTCTQCMRCGLLLSGCLSVCVLGTRVSCTKPLNRSRCRLGGWLTCLRHMKDRCHTCNFIARFCRATLSRDKIARVTWRVVQFLNSLATFFPIRAPLYSVQLPHENAVNADWSILVYAKSCSVRHSMSHLRFCRSIKLQVWHRSK